MHKSYRWRRFAINRLCLFVAPCMFVYVFGVMSCLIFHQSKSIQPVEKVLDNNQFIRQRSIQRTLDDFYRKFLQWNQTLCSQAAARRGPHQKIIAISIFGKESTVIDNPMYSWEKSVLKFLKPLAEEIKILLPDWILRVYVDFTGSQQFHREFFSNFSNIDVCDMENIPMFGSSLLSFLSGRMWRFLPVFDSYVDYFLSRDLDSPMTQREVDTIDIWLSNDQERNFFHITRDHIQHNVPMLAGLWGASPSRARRKLFDIFQPLLSPVTGYLYHSIGDQIFLAELVWNSVKDNALIFDSYSCRSFGGRPYPSQRPNGNCYLGCIRPCCDNTTESDVQMTLKPCPIVCRPREHHDWTYC